MLDRHGRSAGDAGPVAERARTERLTLTAGILVIAGLGLLTLITVAPAALLGLGS